MKERNDFLDASKGFGILLVVMGHAIQTNTLHFDDNIIFRIIYSFHMPLFMLLSGCFAKFNDVKTIIKNVKRLVIPFFFWFIIRYCGLCFITHEKLQLNVFFIKLIKTPDYGLWFLWVLFLCHVCFYALSVIKQKIGFIASILAFVAVQFVPFHSLGIPLLKFLFPYFVGGFLAIYYQNTLLNGVIIYSQWQF